jgi:hypothetical protein
MSFTVHVPESPESNPIFKLLGLAFVGMVLKAEIFELGIPVEDFTAGAKYNIDFLREDPI